ncbi:hypothetical protein C8R45DRAFT_1215019 [Mycena sanguinolenta]|nr:hypothetical protein C8R45DRAFT_1215019 [Mycena sanguinolenta]
MLETCLCNKGRFKLVFKLTFNCVAYVAKRCYTIGDGSLISIIANRDQLVKEGVTLGRAKYFLENFNKECNNEDIEISKFEVTDFILVREGVVGLTELFTPSPASGIELSNYISLSDTEKDLLIANTACISSYSGTLDHPFYSDKQGATINIFQHFSYLFSNKTLVLADIQAAQALEDQQVRESESALERFKKKRRLARNSLPEEPAPPTDAGPSTHSEDPDVEMPYVGERSISPQPSPQPEAPPTPSTEFTAAGRPIRAKQKTWKLLQQLPEPARAPVVSQPAAVDLVPDPPPSTSTSNWVWKGIRTTANTFGLYREYPSLPTYNPDEMLTTEELSDAPGGTRANTATIPSQLTPFAPDDTSDTTTSLPAAAQPTEPAKPSPPPPKPYTGPFQNWSIMGLMAWMWTGSSSKSVEEMNKLIDIIKDPRFSKADIMDFDIKRETAKFDEHLAATDTATVRDGWRHVSVDIPVPDGKKHASEADAPKFSVPGLFYRPIVEVIKGAVQDMGDRCFHYTPFKQFWTPSPGSPSQRVHDEIYASDAMVEAHTALQNQPPEPGCTLERVILSLMWWSDSTHLASFGDAALWPLYLFFGNNSKWLRLKPRSNLCHHVAYFPKLPDSFHDFFKALTGDAPSSDVLTHCRRELMHAIWRLLLDEEFLHACEHGIVIECADGIFRRFFPRIFTYSAGYPEKVLLATIRNLGKAPCPRCYLPKEDIPDLGTVRDDKKRETLARTDEHVHNGTIARIRNWIYTLGRNVKSTTFDFWLLARSWTPTSNAFSDRLSKFTFDPFKMLVPDFMHEFELGVFKSFFIHLLRILYAHGNSSIALLNER